MRTATRPSFAMEAVEDRTLMSVAIMSQFPSICLPMSEVARQATPSSQGPSSGPSSGVNANRPPAAPTGVAAAPAGPGTIDVSWSPVSPNTDTIVVDYSTDGLNYATLAMLDRDATSFRAEGLSTGNYSFKLWAMNSRGTSPASEIVATVLGA